MKVFLSYSRRDSEFVDRLDQALTAGGYDVWVDRTDIAAGGEDRWRRSIVRAIRDSDTVVLVLSPNSTASDNVERELSVAAESRRRVVPVVYRECELPDGFAYELAGLQHVDFATNAFDEATRQLMAQLGSPTTQVRRFEPPPSPPTTPTATSPPTPPTTTTLPPTPTPQPSPPQEVEIDAGRSGSSDGRRRAVLIGAVAGTVLLVAVVVLSLSLGGHGSNDAATATTVSSVSVASSIAPTTEPQPPVTTPSASSTAQQAQEQAVAIVNEWADATSRRDWQTAARIDTSGTIKDYDAWYGRPADASHMERVDVHVDKVAPYDTSWIVKGAVMALDASASRGPSTNVVCSFWVVDLEGHTAAWNNIRATRVRPPLDASGFVAADASYCD